MNASRPLVLLSLLLSASLALAACADGAGSSNDPDPGDTTAGDTTDDDGSGDVDPGDLGDSTGGDTNSDVTDPDSTGGDTTGGDTSTDTTGGDTTGGDTSMDTTMDTDMPLPTACSRDSECGAGEVCRPDSAGALVCGMPIGGGGTATACSSGSDCRTGLCVDDLCTQGCLDDVDCPGSLVCETTDVTLASGMTISTGVCVPPPRPCKATEDCLAGDVCVVDRTGSSLTLLCDDPVGNGSPGDTCSVDGDCDSNLCLDGVCSAPCERPVDCSADGSLSCANQAVDLGGGGSQNANVCVTPPANSCQANSQCSGQTCVASYGTNSIDLTCGAAVGGGSLGGSCSQNANCASNICLDGVCTQPCISTSQCSALANATCELTTLDTPSGGSASASVCVPPEPCDATDDCATGEVCYATRGPADLTLLCDDPNPAGSTVGQVCNVDSDCASNLCVDTRFGRTCQPPCVDNGDCGSGYTCGSAQIPGSGAAPITVDICRPPALEGCTTSASCGTGEVCAVIPTINGTALESVCIPSNGGKATGVGCANNDECTSRVCNQGFCAATCNAPNGSNCGAAQVCADNVSITKNGVSGTFDLCRTLVDVVCDNTADCTAADGAAGRVCSDVFNNGGTAEAHCRFPNAGGSSTGASCSADSQCASDFCLTGVTESCTEACVSNGDCGTGGECTGIGFTGTTNDIGLCTNGCGSSSSCGGTQECRPFEDSLTTSIDLICLPPVGAKDTGASCTLDDECASGLCLTVDYTDNVSCTSDANCSAASDGCFCPASNPGCTTGLCFYTTSQCSAVCRTGQAGADCSGAAGNQMTSCGPVSFSLTSGGTQDVNLCVPPSP